MKGAIWIIFIKEDRTEEILHQEDIESTDRQAIARAKELLDAWYERGANCVRVLKVFYNLTTAVTAPTYFKLDDDEQDHIAECDR